MNLRIFTTISLSNPPFNSVISMSVARLSPATDQKMDPNSLNSIQLDRLMFGSRVKESVWAT